MTSGAGEPGAEASAEPWPARSHAARRSLTRERLTTGILALWLAAAALVTIVGTAILGRRAFDGEPHSWVSAHHATMAHAFLEHGVLSLRGVPIQNNDPLGNQPDAYIHWPPLFPIVLSMAFRWFGESELTGRMLMLFLAAALSATVFALVRTVASPRAGLLAAFAFLVLPVTVVFGRTVMHLTLAVLFEVIAVLAFLRAVASEPLHRGWAAAGIAAMALGVLSSWEPFLAGVGLFAVSWMLKHRAAKRLALAYLAVGALVAFAMIAAYVATYPFLLADLWHTLLFRVGLGVRVEEALPIHAFVDHAEYAKKNVSMPMAIVTLVGRHLELGVMSLVAIVGVVASLFPSRTPGTRRLALLAGGLFGPWILWILAMPYHAVFHEYELMLVAPFAAAAIGIGLAALIDHVESAPHGSRARSLAWVGYVVVPAALLGTAIQLWRTDVIRPAPPTGMVEYATDIEQATGENAVVLSTQNSMVPVYYSRRHVIRGITGDAQLARARASLRGVFPGCPLYLALRPDDARRFPEALRTCPLVRRTDRLVLLSLGTG